MPNGREVLRARIERRWRAGQAADGALGCMLAPAAALFRLGAWVYHRAYDIGVLRAWRAPVPVLSVGNVTVGGTGKTPMTRWLVARLQERGARPGVLHGGYADDEPLLHRSWYPDTPVVVGKDRRTSALDAVAQGATVLVMDDGFQHRRMARDVDVVLVAAEAWSGAAPMLPRGPWRESMRALRRADVLVVTRRAADVESARQVVRALERIVDRPVARVHLAPSGWRTPAGEPRQGAPAECVAVAAIGQPEAFMEQARMVGAPVVELLEFPDHYRYGPGDVAVIRRAARGRALVTTAKDAVKLRRLLDPDTLWVLDQQVVVEEGEDALKEILARVAP
jgi:tetraacyldisaccharide 4'-kinase